MHSQRKNLLLLTQLVGSLLFTPFVLSEQTVKQVIVVTRHGSRLPLRKDGDDLSESTPGVLTPFGQWQLYKVGEWLRETYGPSTGIFDEFDGNKMLLQSSSFERTITSANSLALGLFPGESRDPDELSQLPVIPANVPVYSLDRMNDVLIRAYDKCPAFERKLQDLYDSDEWQGLENTNMQLLKSLAQTTEFATFSNGLGYIPLHELWNVFDMIHVAKKECGTADQKNTTICMSLQYPEADTLLDDEDWERVQTLTHKAETMKYGVITAGKMLGGNLLKEIVTRMQNNDYTFSLFSAHFPTILGIFSALGDYFYEDDTIPHYGAALVFIVTEESTTGKRFFELLYKSDDKLGTSATQVAIVSLDHICTGPMVCAVSDLATYLADWNQGRWCSECENESANICLEYKLANLSGTNTGLNNGQQNEVEDDDDDGDLPAAVGFVIGLAVGAAGILILVVLAKFVCRSNSTGQSGISEEITPDTNTNKDLGMIVEDGDNDVSNGNHDSPAPEEAKSALAMAANRTIT